MVAAAYSTELPRYGVKVGLTNYAAAYCTGLLLARRLLSKLNLQDVEFASEEDDEEGRRPFKANLDVGLRRTSTGAKVFAALKGAVDGGLNIPHSEKRFPGYDKAKDTVDGEVLRKHIMGGHIANYMRELEEESPERYQRQFSRFISAGLSADTIESMYAYAHEAIRADPSPAPKKEKKEPHGSLRFKKVKLNLKQRKDRVRQKKAAFQAKHGIQA